MLVRYPGSIGAAILITAALMLWMQQMIAGGDFTAPTRPPFALGSLPRLPSAPQIHATTLVPSIPPVPRPTLPEAVTAPPNLTTVRIGPDGPVTPPGLSSPQGRPDSRQGPWISDSDLMLVAQAPPTYPFRQIYRGIEGSVVLEFTVSRHGAVEDIEIVESTHPAFAEAARAAVGRWRYRPRVVAGHRVEVRGVRTEITFRLED